VFVNFNPHDRVIGISAVEGIGWRGIPESILGPGKISLSNVYQRIFARNSGIGDDLVHPNATRPGCSTHLCFQRLLLAGCRPIVAAAIDPKQTVWTKGFVNALQAR
jgi:hypothetical protein